MTGNEVLARSQPLVDFQKQVDVIKDPKFNLDTASEALPLDAPTSYWMSVKAYDQLEAARVFQGPVLIGQGGRDYQVSVGEDFETWRSALTGKKGYKSKIWDGLGHLLIGRENEKVGDREMQEELETPDDYAIEGHVREDVVEDICAWMAKQSF